MKRALLSLLLLLWASAAWGLTGGQAVTEALADCDAQNNEDQPFLQYLYLPDPLGEAAFLPALRLHVNLLSRESALAYPKRILPGLYRVDRRDYQWRKQTFDNLALIDPYFHRLQVVSQERVEDWPGGVYEGVYYQAGAFKVKYARKTKSILYVPQGAAQLAALALLTQSNLPIARADWFLVQGARQTSLNNREDTGAGYYDFLGLRNRNDYFRLIGQDDAEAIRIESEIRAVVGESPLSAQNRQIVRQGAINGAHWTTLDVFDQSGRGIAIQNLRRNEFVHNVEEHYGVLPNGLPATFLSDDKGNIQSSAPDKIGSNSSTLRVGNDFRVHVNMACFQCHAGAVLQPVEDDVRPVYTGRLSTQTGSKNVYLELKRQYGANLQRVLDRDREEYQTVLASVTGKTAGETTKLYSEAFTHYAYGRVTVESSAMELGVTPAAYLKSLRDAATRLGRSDFRLDPHLLSAPRTIGRLTWEDSFQDAQDILFGVLKE